MRRELFASAILTLLLTGCEREARRFEDPDPGARAQPPTGPYAENAWAVSEGARLYTQMNCSGCHSHGGGGMGPALKDGAWRYGADAPAVFKTIMDGRPNGMPAFKSRISEQQAWQLVAYVRSLSGQLRGDVSSARDDHMVTGDPINRRPRLTPVKEPLP